MIRKLFDDRSLEDLQQETDEILKFLEAAEKTKDTESCIWKGLTYLDTKERYADLLQEIFNRTIWKIS